MDSEKNQITPRKLWTESATLAVLLLLLGGGAYYLSATLEEYGREHMGVNGELQAAIAEFGDLQAKFEKAKANEKLFQEIQGKHARGELSLERDLLRRRFNEFKDRFFLDALKLSLAGGTPLNDARYKRPIANIISSDVSISFDATNDEDAYALLDAMQNEIPGMAKITQLVLTRDSKVNPAALRAISEKGKNAMVKGAIKFTWYGIKLNEGPNVPKFTP